MRGLLGAVLVVLALVPAAPAHAEVSGGVTIPPFYDPPATLPAADGALVRTGRLSPAFRLRLPGLRGTLPGKARRIMYRSTDAAGQPVAVTGVYLEPTAAWTGGGARPLVAFAEGTHGQGDQCAPSLLMERGAVITPETADVNYEAPQVFRLLRAGVAVVITDYVGLGTTDRVHTYVNRADEAHAVLDAARAAIRLPGASVTRSSPVATYGYSQGGGASAAAAELQPSYAPELRLVAGYAGAPPADLQAVLETIDGTALAGAIGWSVNSVVQAYPELAPKVAQLTNAAGRQALEDLKTECVGDAIGRFAFRQSAQWTATGQPLSAIIAADPQLQAVLDEQRIGRRTPAVPVRITTGTKDDFVGHAQAKQLAADWCAAGASVTYVPVRQAISSGGLGINHLGPAITDGPAAASWVVDRLRGRAAAPNCGALAGLP